jgi:multicomponent Na+:H+ antiporter subunit E
MVARAIAWVLVLSLFWAGLSGYLKPLLVGSGVLSIAFSWWFVRRAKVELVDWSVGRLVLAAVTYLPWLLWQVLLSNLRVIKIVWSPKLPIAPQVVEVPCSLTTPTGKALFANSITMTPGTVTLSVGETLLVHALTAEDAAGVLDGSMHARIAKLEPGFSPAPAPAPAAPPAPEPKADDGALKREDPRPEADAAEAEQPQDEPKDAAEGGAS